MGDETRQRWAETVGGRGIEVRIEAVYDGTLPDTVRQQLLRCAFEAMDAVACYRHAMTSPEVGRQTVNMKGGQ